MDPVGPAMHGLGGLAASAFDLAILDCDGVLVDSEVIAAECLANRLTAAGRPTSVADVHRLFLGRSFDAVRADFLAVTGRPLPEDFALRLGDDLFARLDADLRPVAGAEALLAAMPCPYCLASSSNPARIAKSLTVTGLARFFPPETIFDASMVAVGKPAPDLFLLAAARMGVAPARCLVVEDSVNGIVAGKAAGMTVWAFVGASHHVGADYTAPMVEAGADRVFVTLKDLLPLPSRPA